MAGSSASALIRARAKVVLPAPRGPDSPIRSPGWRAAATSSASVAVAAACADLDPAALAGIADRVGDQVEQDLPDALAVGDEGADVAGDMLFQPNARFREAVLEAFDGTVDGRGDIDLAEVELHDAGID